MRTVTVFGVTEAHCDPCETTDTTGVCARHESHHFCTVCDGWYGVPHNGPYGPHGKISPHPTFASVLTGCACRPCVWARGKR